MSDMYLAPIKKAPKGILNLPGSKSIANRVLLLAAIAKGESIIHNVPSVAEDVVLMLEALQQLGIKITKIESELAVTDSGSSNSNSTASYKIIGCDGVFPVTKAEIFCGNSGTTIRFLTAILALMPGKYHLTGIQRMKERPITDLVYALEQVGSDISYGEKIGFPPLKLYKFKDKGIPVINISGKVSSQYLTGMLMALPLLKREVTLHIQDDLISKPYIEITLALLQKFGCNITVVGHDYTICPNSELQGIEYTIEPDASSASYFLAMGAIKGDITVNNLSSESLQGDKNFAETLAQMGAKVKYLHNSIEVMPGKLNPFNINMESMPDVGMTLAVMSLFTKGTSTVTGITSWKVKETDRIIAMFTELSKLGARVTITGDSISVTPPAKITPDVAIDTYNDHRMAMCFSLLAVYGIPVTIKNYECVGKTFANYFDVFKELCY